MTNSHHPTDANGIDRQNGRLVPINLIRVSAKQRRKTDRSKVRRHVEALESGEECLAIDVNRLADGTYIIAGNGRHRYFAYLEAGFPSIPVRESGE